MSYNLTLTNGTALLTLQDGASDSSTTSINLIGKNFAGYGAYLNENFIKMLEHFSNSAPPPSPLQGQLWWDSTNKTLKVYQGSTWKVISSSTSGSSAPNNPITGDLWWDSTNIQLKVYSGTQWISIGPFVAPGAAQTIFNGNLLTDVGTTTHAVGNLTVNNKISAVVSTDASSFTLPIAVNGLTRVNPGINLISGGISYAPGTESTMLTAGNATLGVSSGNLRISSTGNGNGMTLAVNVGGVQTTAIQINGSNALATVVGNPTTTLGIATKGYVDTQIQTITGGGGGTFAASIIPSANLTYDLGAPGAWWNNIYGTAIHAQYADLAERFEADQTYVPGTVVELGGVAEITAVSQDLSENVFGVISTNAAYLMNSGAGSNQTHPPVAVQGRVPVRVIGKIRKGDRLVSAGNGMARAGARNEISTWNVVGRALEDKTTDGEGTIEAVVKLNS